MPSEDEKIILPIPLEKLFTYSISNSEAQFLRPGMRVAVPFGKTKIYTALVYVVHTTAPTVYEAKEIHQILDEKPIVTEIQIKHWFWIASYYMCAIGDVYRGAMPSALLLESETVISQKTAVFVDESRRPLKRQACQQFKRFNVTFRSSVNDVVRQNRWLTVFVPA